jgi:hypothetical protein
MKKKYLMGALGLTAIATISQAADHGDTPLLVQIARHDARVTDWHAWHAGDKFVMATSVNPNIPGGQASYRFSEDLTVRMHIDRDSAIDYTNAAMNAKYGGVIVSPERISPDITLEFAWDENGEIVMHTEGVSDEAKSRIKVYSGLRDDPFINGLRNGRNVASIVVEMPLADVKGAGSSLLTWTTTKVPDIHSPIVEHSGRALRSQFPENNAMNEMRPRAHYTELGTVPDVAIHNLGAPAGFPNGRLLTDDVIDQVGDPRLTGNAVAQAPTENDKPFLSSFPYLAQPW